MLFVQNVCGRAEEAINYYTSVFGNSKLLTTFRYSAGEEPDKEGTLAYADFVLEGQIFAAMDSAHEHKFNFNEAISFVVNCESQEELDYFWEKLSKGGDPKAQQCGWLKDKFGVSWQIVPMVLGELLSNTDKAQKVMSALLKMKKLDIETLKKA